MSIILVDGNERHPINFDKLPRYMQDATYASVMWCYAPPTPFHLCPMARAWFPNADDHPLFAVPQPAD